MTKFQELNLETQVSIKLIIDVAQLILLTFRKFGSLFKLIVNDIDHNIKRLQEALKHQPNLILKQLIDTEVADRSYKGKKSNFNAVLWLTRCIKFMTHILVNFGASEKSSELITSAYEATLANYHNFFIKRSFKFFCSSAPSKQELAAHIGAIKQSEYLKICQNLTLLTDRTLEYFKIHNLEHFCD